MGFRAFFSYSRDDERVARWVHGQLDSYRTPKALVGTDGKLGPVPAKLHPIFRDRTDMSGGGHLTERFKQALNESETLVVLCSPAAAVSKWVNHEVETFIALGRAERIFPVIAAGLPDSDDVERDFFPPALRGVGLLAADLREVRLPSGKIVGDGREGGRLKLLSGLLGVDLDQLAQRERRRQRALVGGLAAAAVAFAGLAVAAGGLGWLAQVRAVAEREARQLASDNEQRALKGEGEAIANAKLAEDRALAEKRERERADYNADQARFQELAARQNEFGARNALVRMFAERSWDAISARSHVIAARYALAGMQLTRDYASQYGAPPDQVNESAFRIALGRALHDANESIPLTGNIGRYYWNGAISLDGQRVMTCAAPSHIWEVNSGQQLVQLPTTNRDTRCAEFSRDGKLALTYDPTGASVWHADTGQLVSRWESEEWLSDVQFSPDGRFALSDARFSAVLWDPRTGRAVHTFRHVGEGKDAVSDNLTEWGFIDSAEFTPDGAQIVTTSKTIRTWDTQTRLEMSRTPIDANSVLTRLTTPPLLPGVYRHDLSDDGRSLITVWNGVLRVWNAETGDEIALLQGAARLPEEQRRGSSYMSFFGGDEGASHAVFASDSNTILAVHHDLAARLWSVPRKRAIAVLRHSAPVTDALMSQDRRFILTTAEEPTARLWPAPFTREMAAFFATDPSPYYYEELLGVQFNANGREVITVKRPALVQRWRTLDGQEIPGSTRQYSDWIQAFWFGPDSTRIIQPSGVWGDSLSEPLVAVPLHGHAAFTSDGRRFAVLSESGEISVLDATTLRALVTLRPAISADSRLVLNSDGTRIAAYEPAGALHIWRFNGSDPSGTSHIEFQHRDENSTLHSDALKFDTEGNRLVICNELYDAATGGRLLTLGEFVDDAAFSPSGDRIAIASGRGYVRLLDSATGQEIIRIAGHSSGVRKVNFNAAGDRLVSAAANPAGQRHEIRVWDVSRLTQPLAELSVHACNNILGPYERRFTDDQFENDPLLRSVWPDSDRDVCESVAGAAPLSR